jgi:hypothetical protein
VTEETLTPRLAERWAVLFAPLSTDITDWEAGRSGTIMVACTMVLPGALSALTRMVM